MSIVVFVWGLAFSEQRFCHMSHWLVHLTPMQLLERPSACLTRSVISNYLFESTMLVGKKQQKS